jgi:hypothetical protein
VARLFISQERIDRWMEEGKVKIDGEVMSLPALGKSFRLRPAFHFVKIVSDGADMQLVIGRVKTKDQLDALGAEAYGNSVILGESAYEVEPGFVGEVTGAGAMSSGIRNLTGA